MSTEKINIVSIPFHDYKTALVEGFRTRDAHLYSHFNNHPSVNKSVIINRPTLAIELFLKKKTLVTKGELKYKKNGVYITEVKSNVFVVDILDFSVLGPIAKGKGFISGLYKKNIKKIQLALNFLDVKSFVTYESSPLTVELCLDLDPDYRVFDGVDNLCKHSTYLKYRRQLFQYYQSAIQHYQSVMFNSSDSINYFKASSLDNVSFIANGVDKEQFNTKFPMPHLFKITKGRRILYAGKMQEMFDIELVKKLARQFPEDTFFFLGRILLSNIKEQFKDFENVIFTGDVKYELLPAYVSNADVCIIPYLVDNQHGGDPIKFYEYMAANKAIVSTKIGEIEKYHNGVDIFVINRDDFCSSLGIALDVSVGKNINHVLEPGITWKEKADYIVRKSMSEI